MQTGRCYEEAGQRQERRVTIQVCDVKGKEERGKGRKVGGGSRGSGK